MSIGPKQLSRMGEFLLEEAVINVLLEAKHKGECLGAAEISKRAGLYRDSAMRLHSGKDNLIWAILGKIEDRNLVQKCYKNPKKPTKKDGWELTDEAFDLLREN